MKKLLTLTAAIMTLTMTSAFARSTESFDLFTTYKVVISKVATTEAEADAMLQYLMSYRTAPADSAVISDRLSTFTAK